MIIRVWCEAGARAWAPLPVPVTPQTSCRDVLDCCREPGDEPCLLFTVHPVHGVNVLRDSDLPLEVVSALGTDVQFVLKYVDTVEEAKKKRERGANYTPEEKTALADLVLQYKHTIEDKRTGGMFMAKKGDMANKSQ